MSSFNGPFPAVSAIRRLRAAAPDRSPMTRHEERSLSRSIRGGDESARRELVEANLNFVVKLALEHRNLGLPFEDLLNEGTIGLIEAATRFDGERGTKFITYAAWWIRKCMLRALSESKLIRVPTYQRRKARELRAEAERQGQDTSETLDRLELVLRAGLRPRSLDESVAEDDRRSLSDAIADPSAPDVEHEMIRREGSARLGRVLTCLDRRERLVMTQRYGLDGRPPRTLAQIGAVLGVSRERVRQVELEVRRRLRRLLDDEQRPRRRAV